MSHPQLHVAMRKGLFTLEHQNNKSKWAITNSAFVGDNCTMLLDDPRDRTLYAALGHGHFGAKLHRSTDAGRTWSEITAPLYPPMPEGVTPKEHPVFGTPIEWKLVMVWSLEAGGADQPGRLWCGTLPGGLFRSDDHGQSWQLMQSLWDDPRREEWFGGGYPEPGIHSIIVHPDHSQHITISISCGGVWRSTDDGQTWTQHQGGMRHDYMPDEQAYQPNAQDPHRLVACRSDHNRMWVQHHNGIFRSDDAGMNWTECSANAKPSAFGFAVAVHPDEPDTAWFVPGIKDEAASRWMAASWSHAHATAARPLRRSAKACPISTPITWFIDMPSMSMPPATSSPWAPPPAPCSSAKTKATPGNASPPTSPRSPPSASPRHGNDRQPDASAIRRRADH